MPRPPIDLGTKLREIPLHVEDLPAEAERPLSHYRRSASDLWSLRAYVERKIRDTSHYQTVVDRHLATLDRMLLVNLIEAFERFLKEIAAVCVDHLAGCVLDDRFDVFPVSGSQLAAHFGADTIGRSLCESGIWLDCDSINKRFRRLLADPFDPKKGSFYLFPAGTQQPESEKFRHPIISLLWQLRHTIVHNVGVVTQSDAVKLRLLIRAPVAAPKILKPNRDDLRHVRRFLDETAQRVNERVGERLAELLSDLHNHDSTLCDPQSKADELSGQFELPLTVAEETGTTKSS